MWENISIAMPLILGAAALLLVFCAALYVFEKRNSKKTVRRKCPVRPGSPCRQEP